MSQFVYSAPVITLDDWSTFESDISDAQAREAYQLAIDLGRLSTCSTSRYYREHYTYVGVVGDFHVFDRPGHKPVKVRVD